jgi:hypothetical protein
VDVTIGDDTSSNLKTVRKERPIWMVESTVVSSNPIEVVLQNYITYILTSITVLL